MICENETFAKSQQWSLSIWEVAINGVLLGKIPVAVETTVIPKPVSVIEKRRCGCLDVEARHLPCLWWSNRYSRIIAFRLIAFIRYGAERRRGRLPNPFIC